MINFYNLPQALNYRYQCPLCQSSMKVEPGCIEWETKSYDPYVRGNDFYHPGMNGQNYSRTLIKFGDSGYSINIDYETGEVTSVKQTMTDVYGFLTSIPYAYSYTELNSFSIFPISMICSNCHAYKYIVQVHVSLSDMRVVNIVLNSESLTFKDKKGLHLIRNIYTVGKTEYNFHDTGDKDINPKDIEDTIYMGVLTQSAKIIDLPLIPMNMEEPIKTLERVKTLVLFS